MRRNVTFWTGALLVAYSLLTFACRQPDDPLARLELVASRLTVAQIAMPGGPPSALPNTQRRLNIAALRLGAHVEYGPMDAGEYGRTVHDTRVITINEILNADTRTTTLAHELAHLLQPPGLQKGEAEVWVEGVAFLVVRPERDELFATAHYIAFYKMNLNVLRVYRREVLFAAAFLRGEIE
jgi:hypothetical protein